MNKPELAKVISEKAGVTIKDADAMINAFTDAVTETMSKGEDVSLIGFGTFSVATHAARTARNFHTKEIINVPESKTVRFKVGKKLKDTVN